MRPPRVAYFPDSFHEVNGVAHTSRHFVAYAKRHALPFLCVRAGGRAHPVERIGTVETLELPRSILSVGMEKDLAFDPIFWRHADAIEDALHGFKPDVVHLTGPSELGIFAAYFAWKLAIPLAASWHTNVHEYAAKRMTWLTRKLPTHAAGLTSQSVERGSLGVAQRFYAQARVLFAPNRDLCDMLEGATGRHCHLMQRGVDTDLFSPVHRVPQIELDGKPHTEPQRWTLGFVGRLSIEKNVALLTQIQQQLDARGVHAHFLIVGHGDLEADLRKQLPTAEFTGVLRGDALAAAYARMDLFVFPSHTDTFGNVVLEAMASGVPAIVTPDGGPRFIVEAAASGQAGVVAPDVDFAEVIVSILNDPARLQTMREAARAHAMTYSWDAVFDRVYEAYDTVLPPR